MNEINKRIAELVEYGSQNYIAREYYETPEMMQRRMDSIQFNMYVTTNDDIFHFVTRDEILEIPLKEVDVDIFWNELGNVPTDDNDDIEQKFLHFDIGTEKNEIWHWFESFFNISLGEKYF